MPLGFDGIFKWRSYVDNLVARLVDMSRGKPTNVVLLSPLRDTHDTSPEIARVAEPVAIVLIPIIRIHIGQGEEEPTRPNPLRN